MQYEAVRERQLQLQRDLNALLQRKAQWSDADVQRFAELYRSENKLDAQVSSAKSWGLLRAGQSGCGSAATGVMRY
jgi:hypothetical protein